MPHSISGLNSDLCCLSEEENFQWTQH